MGKLKFGYQLQAGKVAIDPKQATIVRTIFTGFLNGTSRRQLSLKFGMSHASIQRILTFQEYSSGSRYPNIIEPAIFNQVQERLTHAIKRKPKPVTKPVSNFYHGILKHRYKDPFKQAEYIYSLIQTEEEIYG